MQWRRFVQTLFVISGAVLAPAHAVMVEFGDADFAPGPAVCVPGSAAGSGAELADYELVRDVRGGPDGFTCVGHQAAGGNPGAWAEVTIIPEGGQIIACMFKNDALYDPSVLGGFAYVDFTEDGICAGGGPQCMSSGVCVRQAGNLYFASAGFVPEVGWTPKAAYGLSPTDFSWLSGPTPGSPDFSATGALLQFGFYRAKSGGPGPVTGVDNWRVVTHDACTADLDCDDANGCTAESCVTGVCERGPLDCDDGDGCTQDVCSDGVCSHPPIVCDDFSNCTLNTCVDDGCQFIPSVDFGLVSDEIDALLAILEGPVCGDEVLKRSLLRKFTKKLKKVRGKVDKADTVADVLKIPGLRGKAVELLEKARLFLAGQATKGTLSAECAQALTAYVYHIDGCLAFVPTL
jgi:hypothetical protein